MKRCFERGGNVAEPLKMLAFDLGASSGRAILGVFDGKKLTLEEIHRFSNDPVEVRGSLHWDILRLFHEIKQGILKCVNGGHRDIASMAIDTWGVDFGLLDRKGNLLGNPFHYRDSNTDGMMEEVFKIIPEKELYAKTGIQLMKINTIFRLFSMKFHDLPIFKEADTMLPTPDLLNYFLTGVKASEYSIASTTQLLDPKTSEWSWELIKKIGLPTGVFPKIVPPGHILGRLSPEIARELGIDEIPVVSAASHDTQSAVVSVPAENGDFVYISCGTWSLMGIETDRPIINDKSREMAFTNEGGVDGKITFLKNIMGLWLIQECRRQWEREGDRVGFAELEAAAGSVKPFMSFINPDDEMFISPGDMPGRIREYCRKTSQPVPSGKGEVIRCIYQSLAMKYRMTVEYLEEILGRPVQAIHMVGGGIRDKTLCRLTADATGKKVAAGPVEATSIGNLMVQAMALGRIKDLKDIRDVVRSSFPVTVYEPGNTEEWIKAYELYRKVTSA